MQTISVPTEKGKTMTALEYMEKQVHKHKLNLIREEARKAHWVVIYNIERKISYYEEAIVALKERNNNES